MQKIVKKRSFKHKGLDYETLAIVDLFENVVRVEILNRPGFAGGPNS